MKILLLQEVVIRIFKYGKNKIQKNGLINKQSIQNF